MQRLPMMSCAAKQQALKKEFKNHLTGIEADIEAKKQEAENLPAEEVQNKDVLYQQVDELKKARDKKIEEILEEILPEAFAVVKETARRF